MEPTPEQLKRLKEIELAVFKQFITVCEKLQLTYYLLGGTLLGAVRHKGFIPWDDDIDVGMPRKDYEVFLEKGQALLPKKYFIQTCYTDEQYALPFCKVRDCETTFVETWSSKSDINHGVFIDIFPLDFYPEEKREEKRFDRKYKWLTYCRYKACVHMRNDIFAKVKRFIINTATCFVSARQSVKKMDALLKSTKESKRFGNLCGAWGKKEIGFVDWYGEGREVEFEGIKSVAPCKYELWLEQVYGDYMQLPPEEKRVGHHYTVLIDLEKSYLNYRK